MGTCIGYIYFVEDMFARSTYFIGVIYDCSIYIINIYNISAIKYLKIYLSLFHFLELRLYSIRLKTEVRYIDSYCIYCKYYISQYLLQLTLF